MDSLLLSGAVGAVAPAPDAAGLLWELFVVFVAAKLGAELAERVGVPSVVAEILAGVVVGPEVLKLVHPNEATAALSELGAVFLLFLVGLQTRPRDILRVGKEAFLVASAGVALPFVFGFLYIRHAGYATAPSLLVGAALVATSVGITARVLTRLGVVRAVSSRIILAAAVIDDVLGLLVLAVVSSFLGGEGVHYGQIAVTLASVVAFVLVMLVGGVHVVERARPMLERLRIGHSLYIAAIIFCLLLSAAAGSLGIAAIVGAFLAGMAFSETSHDTGLNRWFDGLAEFLVPFFLAGIGMQVNLASLTSPAVLGMGILLTVVAAAGKVVGAGIPVWRRGWRTSLRVGFGMIPRGEVEMIVAQFGLRSGVFGPDLFAVVVFVVVASTILAPPVLTRLYAGGVADEGESPPDGEPPLPEEEPAPEQHAGL